MAQRFRLNSFMLLATITIFIIGCGQSNKKLEKEIVSDSGVVKVDMFRIKNDVTSFIKIREVTAQQLLLVHEGSLSGKNRHYEVSAGDGKSLIAEALSLVKSSLKQGYKIYKEDSFVKMVVEVQSGKMDLTEKEEEFALVEDLIGVTLDAGGNGRLIDGEMDEKMVFYIIVFDPNFAKKDIPAAFESNGINLPVTVKEM